MEAQLDVVEFVEKLHIGLALDLGPLLSPLLAAFILGKLALSAHLVSVDSETYQAGD